MNKNILLIFSLILMAFIGLSAVAASDINTADDMASSDMQAITITDADDMDFDDVGDIAIDDADDVDFDDVGDIAIDDVDDVDFDDDDYSCRQFCFGDSSNHDQIMRFFDFNVKNIHDLDLLKIYDMCSSICFGSYKYCLQHYDLTIDQIRDIKNIEVPTSFGVLRNNFKLMEAYTVMYKIVSAPAHSKESKAILIYNNEFIQDLGMKGLHVIIYDAANLVKHEFHHDKSSEIIDKFVQLFHDNYFFHSINFN